MAHSPVEVERHKARSLRLVAVGVEEDAPLGHGVQSDLQLRLGGAQHELGGRVDLGEMGDPHDEGVLLQQQGMIHLR